MISPSEQAKLRVSFNETKGSRNIQTEKKELNEYLIEEWGSDYQIVQSRSPDNKDCIIRKISTGQELSAALCAKKITNHNQKGSNKIAHMALQRSKKEPGWGFHDPIKTIRGESRGCFTNELL